MASEVGRHPVVTRAALESAAPTREPGPELVARIARRARFSLVAANLAGAVIVGVLGTWVVPFPAEGKTPSNILANSIGFGVVMIVGLLAGNYLSGYVARDAQRWLLEDRTPTPTERRATLRFPLRQTMVEALLWLAVAAIFFVINVFYSERLACQTALEIVLGGLVTCSLTYLLAERINHPATVRALESEVPESPTGPAIGCRLLLTWAA